MIQRFRHLSIHRKLVFVGIVILAPAMIVATLAIAAIDVYRSRGLMVDDAASLAGVIGENIAASVMFQDPDDARRMLEAVRIRPNIVRACVYLASGALFTGYSRTGDCPATLPAERPWPRVIGTSAIMRAGARVGTVFVERELAQLWPRVATAAVVNMVVLELTALVALFFSGRLQRLVAQPIVDLATAARRIDPDRPGIRLPLVDSGTAEVDELARSLTAMLDRLDRANREVRRRQQETEEALEREQRANRMKDDFLAAVSHELRTPLGVIATWSQMLLSVKADPATVATGLTAIDRNARAQGRLIDDLVDSSRIASGRFSLSKAIVDLRMVVAEAVEAARAQAERKQIHIEYMPPPGQCLVDADRQRLQQAVANLIENAAKFSAPSGMVAVSVDLTGTVGRVTVKDFGVGIDPEFLPLVFDAFRQADGTLTRRHEGLGLGLAIVKQIVQMHGGTVEASSDGLGRGATFVLRLPCASTLAHLPEGGAPGATPVRLDGLHVMVVDDNDDARDTLARALAFAGATVTACRDGADAVKTWASERFDLCLCDLAMPVMNGFDVFQALQAHDAGSGRATLAISVSAHATNSYLARSRAAGFSAHLAKPYQLEEMLKLVSDVVAGVTR